ncbi:MAG: hypothetical protein IH912_06100, partial [Proteobacteria bacterium]|nr:hypothetical protein [Pseudomonadota bacterium]
MKSQRFTLISLIALTLWLTSCSRQEAPAEPQANATDTRNELATRAGAPLFDGMGDHHHPITASDPDAQRY